MYSIKNPKKVISYILLVWTFLLFHSFTSKAQYTINDTFGDLVECDTMTRGIFIIWWDKNDNLTNEVDALLDTMLSYRNTCLDVLNMEDPPNTPDGFFYNVYLHGNGFFSTNGWGNGQGTDSNGYPFLTLPSGILSDHTNTAHETFHIFQYSANAPGFAYAGDSQWYIEASANWFAARQNLNALRRFVEAESLVRVPQVPFWLSFNNYPNTYPNNWQRYVHQYALALHLYYLTDVVGINEDIITSGLFSGTTELPQEYMYNIIGSVDYRKYFIDWAAHMTNDFDFIPANQAATNLNEWNTYADPVDDNEFVAEYINEGTNGWITPDDDKVTNAWSFNTYKLINSQTETYTFEVNGNLTGNYGGNSFFQGKVLVKSSVSGDSFYDLDMMDDYQGSLSLDLTPDDTEVYFIIAAMPEVFEDDNPTFQLFPYMMKIELGESTPVSNIDAALEKVEVARFNLLGQKIESRVEGFQIILYEDGSVEKVYEIIE